MINWLSNLFSSTKAASQMVEVRYQTNDPFTPDLVRTVNVPVASADHPPFAVQGWNGRTISEMQKQAAQVHTALYFTRSAVKKYLKQPLERWAATNVLIAVPRAGRQFNAYYDRTALKFFYDVHPTTGKIVFSCESNDVVAHEA